MSVNPSMSCMSCGCSYNQSAGAVPYHLRADTVSSFRVLLADGWLAVGCLPTQGVDVLCPSCAANLNSEVKESFRRQAAAYRKELQSDAG
jgi:hypothetical protein